MAAAASSSRFAKLSLPLWTLFILYNAGLFYFSLLPGNELPRVFIDWSDKALHAGGYFVLFVLGALVCRVSRREALNSHFYLWPGWWAINVGAVTEFMQHFVPGRFTDPLDMLANAAGMAAGLAALFSLNFHGKKGEKAE